MVTPNSSQTCKSYTHQDTEKCEVFAHSIANNAAVSEYQKDVALPDPCGTSTMSKINIELIKFFDTLKGIKKYYDLYVNGTINKIQGISSLIRNSSKIIGAVLKILINRLRDYLLDKIRRGLEDLMDKLFPNLLKMIQNTIIQTIVDNLFCSFKNIVKGLANLVTDFLFELIGKAVNAPFCLAQQFTNALVNNVAAIIDKSVAPILDKINDILGGVTKIAGSVFQALDYILGFEAFICAKPNCPEIKKFKASPWAGPTETQIDQFNKFLPIPTADDIIGSVDDYISNLEVFQFGKKIGDVDSIPSNITQCNTEAFKCGPPKVSIFGGGGAGAVGQAVVDNIGRTIGVDLVYGGSNYSRPPFVTFEDSCETTFTTGYAEIKDGKVTNIVMTSTPVSPPEDGRTEFDLPSETNLPSNNFNDYVICLEGFRVINTGSGYTTNDSIEISPDIPNLNSTVQLTEFGQIVKLEIRDKVCGLTEYPTIVINSDTGDGAVIEPIISFVRVEEYSDPDPVSDPDRGSEEILDFDSDFIIRAELNSGNNDGLVTTLRGRKILPETQEFTRNTIIRIVDCVT